MTTKDYLYSNFIDTDVGLVSEGLLLYCFS